MDHRCSCENDAHFANGPSQTLTSAAKQYSQYLQTPPRTSFAGRGAELGRSTDQESLESASRVHSSCGVSQARIGTVCPAEVHQDNSRERCG